MHPLEGRGTVLYLFQAGFLASLGLLSPRSPGLGIKVPGLEYPFSRRRTFFPVEDFFMGLPLPKILVPLDLVVELIVW